MNVSYDPTRELYDEFNRAFAEHWKKQTGQEVKIDRESSLLRYMTENAGRVITRDEMLLRVWRLNPQRIITRTIDMHIVHLRAKLGDDPKHPKILLTVRGEGYVFTGKTRSENESETAVNPR